MADIDRGSSMSTKPLLPKSTLPSNSAPDKTEYSKPSTTPAPLPNQIGKKSTKQGWSSAKSKYSKWNSQKSAKSGGQDYGKPTLENSNTGISFPITSHLKG